MAYAAPVSISAPAQSQQTEKSSPVKNLPTTTVVVKALAPPVVHKIDRTVYNLQGNPQAASGSVSDILTSLPSVYVDPRGNVSVRGDSVSVYIDGKPAPQFRGVNVATALQAMPANTLASIEVITNPGPEFRTSARTIINLVTRKTKDSTPAGDLIINAGPDARYNATFIGSFGAGKWSFMGSVALRQDQWTYFQASERDQLGSDGQITSRLIEDEAWSRRLQSTTLNGSATYKANDKDSVVFAANMTVRNLDVRHDDTDAFSGLTDAKMLTRAYGPDDVTSRSLSATYKHKEQGDDGVTLQFTHAENNSRRDFRYGQADLMSSTPDRVYRRASFGRSLTDTLTGDYVHSLRQYTQFKAGFDIESARNQDFVLATDIDANLGIATINPDLTSRFLSDSRLLAAYAQYQTPMGKWLIMGGFRLERHETKYTSARDIPFSGTADTELSPSLYLSRPLSDDSKLKFSFSRHINRPSPDQLNSAIVQVDPQDLSVGNPYLKPSRDDAFEASYDYTTKPTSFIATAYFRHDVHTISPYAYYRAPGDLVLVSTFENAGHETRGGLDMSLDLHPSKAVGFSLSGDFYTTALEAPVGQSFLRQSIASYLAKANLTWKKTPTENMQVTYVVSGPSLMALGAMSGRQTFILSYSHTLSPKLKFTASIADAFNTGQTRYNMQSPQLRLRVKSFAPGQFAYVGFDYKFGSTVKK
jgi:outer membrane receptor protein involved in Fe transport